MVVGGVEIAFDAIVPLCAGLECGKMQKLTFMVERRLFPYACMQCKSKNKSWGMCKLE
jgi:hypothetical protein